MAARHDGIAREHPVSTQAFSCDPLQDGQKALPERTPSECRLIQSRQRLRDTTQDAPALLDETSAGSRRVAMCLSVACDAHGLVGSSAQH